MVKKLWRYLKPFSRYGRVPKSTTGPLRYPPAGRRNRSGGNDGRRQGRINAAAWQQGAWAQPGQRSQGHCPSFGEFGPGEGPEGAFRGSLVRNKRLLKQLATLKEGPL